MATWKTFATKLGLMEPEVEKQVFMESNMGLCLTCGSLKFNPDCPECRQSRWQSLVMGINGSVDDTADVQG